MSEQGEKKQTGKGILVIGIIAIVVVAVLIGIIIFLVVSQNKPVEKVEEKRQVLVTEDNVEEIVQDLVEEQNLGNNDAGYYSVTMFFEWHFKDGSEPSYDSYVKNVEQNTNDVYFDIVMADDESQVLYKSPVIPRGGELDKIKLDRDLDAGIYETVCIYYLVDEEQNPISQVRVGLTLNIEG